MEEAARKWFKQALHDLEMAEQNIYIGGYDVASFLAHQAVEKALKGALILQGASVPKTHYLEELAKLLSLPESLEDAVRDLSPDYMLSRYPDVAETVPYEEYNEAIAWRKVSLAYEVIEFLKVSYGGLE